jgi:hypothetical protein
LLEAKKAKLKVIVSIVSTVSGSSSGGHIDESGDSPSHVQQMGTTDLLPASVRGDHSAISGG